MRRYAVLFLFLVSLPALTACSWSDVENTFNPKRGYAAFVFDLCESADRQMEKYLSTKNQDDRLRAMDMQIQCTQGLTKLGLLR